MNPLFLNPRKYEERFYWTLKEVITGSAELMDDYLYNWSVLEEILSYMIDEGYSTPIWDSVNETIKSEYRGILDLVIEIIVHKFSASSNNFF